MCPLSNIEKVSSTNLLYISGLVSVSLRTIRAHFLRRHVIKIDEVIQALSGAQCSAVLDAS